MSAEPSMEDILSSIKRIIAEEGDAGAPRHRRTAQGRAAPLPMSRDDDDDEDEVLELSDPIAAPVAPPPLSNPRPSPAATRAPAAHNGGTHDGVSHHDAEQHRSDGERRDDGRGVHVSAATAEATRGALDSLSRLLVRPEPDSDGTLEGLVREMLRPMVSAWLDRNLPAIVEQLVAREIAKITAGQG